MGGHYAQLTPSGHKLKSSANTVPVMAFDLTNDGSDLEQAISEIRQGKLVVFVTRGDRAAGGGTILPQGLSKAEACRYRQYKSTQAAEQFLQGRMLIRKVLASYLSVRPEQIDVTCQEHVKPVASCSVSGMAMPHFSLSHSGDAVVLGLHRTRQLGLDIECALPTDWGLASDMKRLFTPREQEFLGVEMDRERRAHLFLNLWRSKEAIMKATGLGFLLASDGFDVLTPCGQFASVVWAGERAWHLEQIVLQAGLECAIAIDAHNI